MIQNFESPDLSALTEAVDPDPIGTYCSNSNRHSVLNKRGTLVHIGEPQSQCPKCKSKNFLYYETVSKIIALKKDMINDNEGWT